MFAALDPARRDVAPADGGWSAKDILAHLSAWRQQQTDRLAALREGRAEPPSPATEIDDINASLHDRAGGLDAGSASPPTPNRRPTA